MTVVNYLTKTELPSAFNTSNLDATAQMAVINQLVSDGLYTGTNPDDGKSIWVESDIFQGVAQPPLFGAGGSSTVPNFVQALEVEGSSVNVTTDATLKIIVDDGSGANNLLNVGGGANNMFVALGNSNTTVNLNDAGNDTVLAGSGGADSITANSGMTELFAGGGADTLVGGSGASSLYGGSGPDTLTSGTGHNQLLQAGASGSDQLTDLLSGGTDTLVAGGGPDTITGVQGDYFGAPFGPTGSNDFYNIHDGPGNSTINLGTGADSVSFLTTAGNDTISNGGANTDTINYTGSSTNLLTDVQSITPGTGAQTGNYLVPFTDGQTADMVGHGVASTKIAFTLDFTDGTLNLKGGS
jgi:Ca2+-binding RTX toxin-like protein